MICSRTARPRAAKRGQNFPHMIEQTPADSLAIEAPVIACLLLGEWDESLCPELFTHPTTRAIFMAAKALYEDGKPIDEQSVMLAGNGDIPFLELAAITETTQTAAYFRDHLSRAKRALAARKRARLSMLVANQDVDLSTLRAGFTEIIGLERGSRSVLDKLRFDARRQPPAVRPIFSVGRKHIATCGNLVVIASQPGSGKSAFAWACVAASTGLEGDTLHVSSTNPNSHAVIVLDTEQSEPDFYRVIYTAFSRVNVAPPEWLYAYAVVPLTVSERLQALRTVLVEARRKTGGIHSVFLDGIADFVNDPNDPQEAFTLVADLHRLAVQYDTAVVCVVHFNPNPKFQKTRGHLGSQLDRKAEISLSIDKTADGRVTVTSTKSRRAPIFKSDGVCFVWSDHCGKHMSCDPAPKHEGRF